MTILIALALFSFLMIIITAYGHRRYIRPSRVLDQLGKPAQEDHDTELAGEGGIALPVRLFQQIGEQVPVSPQDLSMQRRVLIGAGFRSESAVYIFYGIKIVATVGLFAVAFLFVRDHLPANAVLRTVFLVASALAGFFGPNLVLDHLVSRRQTKLRLALPDALDLMVVCVEAGLGLDQAMLNVSRELQLTHPEVTEEFSLVNLEMRAGKPRAEALRNLAARTGEPEIRKLVAILVQTDRFGTSMGDSLRTHSDFMRVRRRQLAEERAGKVGVKLVFPIFFFIMPAMFIVAAGPGVLQVVKYLFPMMKQFHT